MFAPALFRTFLFRQFLSLGAGEFFQLLFAHRFRHLFGSAFQLGLLYFSALGGERRPGGHLLFFGFCWHTWSSRASRSLRLSGSKKPDVTEIRGPKYSVVGKHHL